MDIFYPYVCVCGHTCMWSLCMQRCTCVWRSKGDVGSFPDHSTLCSLGQSFTGTQSLTGSLVDPLPLPSKCQIQEGSATPIQCLHGLQPSKLVVLTRPASTLPAEPSPQPHYVNWVCVCVCGAYHDMLVEVSSLLPPCGFQGVNSGPETGYQVPFPDELAPNPSM